MSDDLISRKTIKSQIETIRDCWGTSPFVSSSDMKLYAETFNVVLQTISDCHTAFNKEKVIEELQKHSHNYYPSIDHYCLSRKAVDLKDAIEIVEKGGTE